MPLPARRLGTSVSPSALRGSQRALRGRNLTSGGPGFHNLDVCGIIIKLLE